MTSNTEKCLIRRINKYPMLKNKSFSKLFNKSYLNNISDFKETFKKEQEDMTEDDLWEILNQKKPNLASSYSRQSIA